MKIMGMGIPELIILALIIGPIVAIIFAVISSSKKDRPKKSGSVEPLRAPSASASASYLKSYKELLDMGAITQEEYDAKKKDLLGL